RPKPIDVSALKAAAVEAAFKSAAESRSVTISESAAEHRSATPITRDKASTEPARRDPVGVGIRRDCGISRNLVAVGVDIAVNPYGARAARRRHRCVRIRSVLRRRRRSLVVILSERTASYQGDRGE